MKKYFILVLFVSLSSTGCDSILKFFKDKDSSNTMEDTVYSPDVEAQEVSAEDMAELQRKQLTKAENDPEDSVWPVSEDVKPCKAGVAAKVLNGQCNGEWTIRTNSSPTACLFTWGPAISCPEGLSPITNSNACTGYIANPILPEHEINGPADCISKYGETPVSASYEVQCCPTPEETVEEPVDEPMEESPVDEPSDE